MSAPHQMMVRPRGEVIYSLSNLNSSYSDADFGAATYQVQLWFQTDGSVDVLRAIQPHLQNEEQHTDPGYASAGTSVRITHISGSDMTAGETRGDWHAITTGRIYVMSYAAAGGPDTINGTFDIELSDDGGATIVATKSGVLITAGSL